MGMPRWDTAVAGLYITMGAGLTALIMGAAAAGAATGDASPESPEAASEP
jgi:hypothetical protein